MKFSCRTCDGRFEAEHEHLGTEIPCPHCGEVLALPEDRAIDGEIPITAATSARQYWCFISYRHNDNKQEGRQLATWLHQAIETYEVPADLVGTRNETGEEIPARIFPVFRDEEEPPADADLSRPIIRALHNSRYLVALCSSTSICVECFYFHAQGRSLQLV